MILAYHGKKELKKSYIDRLEAHRKAEELVQGVGFESNGKTRGCNIGCLFDYYDYAKGAAESGIPEVLLRLADTLFEGLPVKEANDFAIEWPKAIAPGVDLSKIHGKFCAFIMRENIERVLLLKIDDRLREKVVGSIQTILKLHEKEEAAESAARSAAESAVKSAVKSAALEAWSAAGSVALEARSAALAAVAAVKSASESAAYKRYAKEFIRLLKEAK